MQIYQEGLFCGSVYLLSYLELIMCYSQSPLAEYLRYALVSYALFGGPFLVMRHLWLLKFGTETNLLQGSGKDKKEKAGISLVDVAYRRAKAVKAKNKAVEAGKLSKVTNNKSKRPSQKTQSRSEEMHDLFQTDMSEKKAKRSGGMGKKKTKSFKSKSRYEVYLHFLFFRVLFYIQGALFSFSVDFFSSLIYSIQIIIASATSMDVDDISYSILTSRYSC